jgi:hypothetical protein
MRRNSTQVDGIIALGSMGKASQAFHLQYFGFDNVLEL